MKHLASLAAVGLVLFATGVHAEEAKPVVVKQIFSTTTTATGQPIRLPQGDVKLTVSEYRIAPGAKLPVHQHPFPRYGYMLEGTLSVTLPDTGQTFTYGPGDVIAEVVGLWHFGANNGTVPVRLLVIDQAPGDQPATILKQ